MMTDTQANLYERVGGYNGIYAMSAKALRKLLEHPDTGYIWANRSEASLMHEHINLTDFLAMHFGGAAKYRGLDMATVHRGMGLTEVHWRAFLECLDACYEDDDLPQDLRDEITAFFTKFKGVVIGSPSYRDVILEHPDMDLTKGLKSVGINWPRKNSA